MSSLHRILIVRDVLQMLLRRFSFSNVFKISWWFKFQTFLTTKLLKKLKGIWKAPRVLERSIINSSLLADILEFEHGSHPRLCPSPFYSVHYLPLLERLGRKARQKWWIKRAKRKALCTILTMKAIFKRSELTSQFLTNIFEEDSFAFGEEKVNYNVLVTLSKIGNYALGSWPWRKYRYIVRFRIDWIIAILLKTYQEIYS